jgi:glycosyltransferase involved in cell wall biosynthesis
MSQPPAADRALTIAWLINGDEGYGVANGILTLTGAVRDRGHMPLILSLLDGALTRKLREAGMEVVVLGDTKSPNFAGSVLATPQQAWRLWRFQRAATRRMIEALRRRPADILHIRRPTHVTIAGKAGRAMGIPTIWQMPNPIGDRYPFGVNRRLFHRACVRLNVLPVANSHFTAASLGPGRADVKVLHLAIDPGRWDPEAPALQRGELGIGEDWIVFGLFARVQEEKGHERFLQAMLSIEDPPAPLCLLAVGGPEDGALAQRLRALAGAAGASDRLILTGLQDAPERYYSVVDVAINPRINAEAFGHSVIEAMMMGRPVLANPLGGPGETVRDGETGWHTAGASVDDFARAIRRALAERDRWPQMGARGREIALREYAIDGYVDQYLELVRRRIAAPGGPSPQRRTEMCESCSVRSA